MIMLKRFCDSSTCSPDFQGCLNMSQKEMIILFYFVLTVGASYTLLYNLLNFPAGSLPVTKVTKDDEASLQNYTMPIGIGNSVKRV